MDGSMEKSCREHCGFRLTSPQALQFTTRKLCFQGSAVSWVQKSTEKGLSHCTSGVSGERYKPISPQEASRNTH